MSGTEAKNRGASRLLIIDDDPLIRVVAHERLTAEGFEVSEAEGGAEGLEAFWMLRPNLVLLDVEMPQVDGFEVCQSLRSTTLGKHVPILILTGLDDLASIERAYNVGATDFISKPLNWAILAHRIRYMLRANDILEEVRSQQDRLDQVQQLRGSQPLVGMDDWLTEPGSQHLVEMLDNRTPVLTGEKSASPVRADSWAGIDPPNSDPVLDDAMLEQLERVSGSGGLVERVISVYLEKSLPLGSAIRDAAQSGDADELARGAHRLKSGSFEIGARRVGSLCGRLEHAARTCQLDGVESLTGELEFELERLREALESRLAGGATASESPPPSGSAREDR